MSSARSRVVRGDGGVDQFHDGVAAVGAQPHGLVDAGGEQDPVDEAEEHPAQERLLDVVPVAEALGVDEEHGAGQGCCLRHARSVHRCGPRP
ncbi:hypothetical protein GCM10020254_37090 [Streptomyces goshikiensis]